MWGSLYVAYQRFSHSFSVISFSILFYHLKIDGDKRMAREENIVKSKGNEPRTDRAGLVCYLASL